VNDGQVLEGCAQALLDSSRDFDFVDFWWVPAIRVDAVLEHLRRGGRDPEEILLHDPESAALQLQTMAELEPEPVLAFTTRYWPECPNDLADALAAFGNTDKTVEVGRITSGPTKS
jgi:hypothetical protein